MRKLLKLILRQHDIGQWWGGIRHTVSNATMYITLFNTVLLVPMAYVTWVQPFCEENGVVFPFWMFLSVIAVLAVVLLLVEYKLFTPSMFNFWSAQFWQHNNPIRKELRDMDKRWNKQFKELQEIIEKQNTSR